MDEANPQEGRRPRRPSFLPYEEVIANRADAALWHELRAMLPDTTDDLEDPWQRAARKT
ncbi:hypothetical protein [Kutzneria sp. 744]|uniref:hypothetical protein n=1 Tax=Kutzneria sp. (strain 744) TaxID=345341 RepID=UPI0004B37040|nr:hypothetical protein [Kutzneria sp. 744]